MTLCRDAQCNEILGDRLFYVILLQPNFSILDIDRQRTTVDPCSVLLPVNSDDLMMILLPIVARLYPHLLTTKFPLPAIL